MTALQCHPKAVPAVDRADQVGLADLLPAAVPATVDHLPANQADRAALLPTAAPAMVGLLPVVMRVDPAGQADLVADPAVLADLAPRQSR
jgi:hypothetical protein